ncbi:hypothetical protein AB8O55_22465 [Saccharopolyspora cebuensis]|uniref:Uncharacterized protein n=1 Tax=Saccharopolyspora cebuensis TaxID=418759 RepID=A0ABV4CM86_9PSEU
MAAQSVAGVPGTHQVRAFLIANAPGEPELTWYPDHRDTGAREELHDLARGRRRVPIPDQPVGRPLRTSPRP